MAKCMKCQLDGLEWDHDWKEKTGKWRLYSKNQERPHDCNPQESEDYWCCDICKTRSDGLVCKNGHTGHWVRKSLLLEESKR